MRNLILLQHRESALPPSFSVGEALVNPKICLEESAYGGNYITSGPYLHEVFGHVFEVVKVLKNGEHEYMGLLAGDEGQGPGDTVAMTHVLGDLESLCVLLTSGEMYLINLNDPPSDEPIESFGTMDTGITSGAWSPEEEILVITTGANKMLLLTQEFHVLSEVDIFTDETGEAAQVNVGWGNKKTQFHGSAGKAAAQTVLSTADATEGEGDTQIAWRGDGKLFAVSIIGMDGKRTLRIYSREGTFQCTGEQSAYIHGEIAWRWPLTGLLAAPTLSSPTQPRPHIAFYEKNGLKHGEIVLADTRGSSLVVRCMEFNPQGDALCLAISVDGVNTVQVWTCSNYHWFRKMCIVVSDPVEAIAWEAERPLSLHVLTTTDHSTYSFAWAINGNEAGEGGVVSVIDGDKLNITPLRYANVPPPMSASSVQVDGSVFAVTYGISQDGFALVYARSDSIGYDIKLYEYIPLPRGKTEAPRCIGSASLPAGHTPKHITVISDSPSIARIVYASADEDRGDILFLMDISKEGDGPSDVSEIAATQADILSITIESQTGRSFAQLEDGSIVEVCISPEYSLSSPLATFPEACAHVSVIHDASSMTPTFIGLSSRGRLYIGESLISAGITSFTVHDDYVILSTSEHTLRFIRKSSVFSGPVSFDDTLSRRMERGGKIVTAIPHETGVVLQMPRGNLETVHPHLLVVTQVCRDLDNHKYKEAFLACRKNRVDLNVLYDHSPAEFIAHVDDFISQVERPDYVDLFTSSLSNEDKLHQLYGSMVDSTPVNTIGLDKMNSVCRIMRVSLIAKDPAMYRNSIIVTLVREDPPNLEEALELVNALKNTDKPAFESALDFLVFLVQTERLYDAALGLYDLPLVLSVLQRSHSDPREYLPVLRELKSMEPLLMYARIDDQLGKKEKSLGHLYAAGASSADAWLQYATKHALYPTAIAQCEGDAPRRKAILTEYGTYLIKGKDMKKAGQVFVLAGDYAQAAKCYAASVQWREAMSLACIHTFDEDTIQGLALTAYEFQRAERKALEASQIQLEYLKDTEEAVECLVEGYEYAEAKRVALVNERADLVESTIQEGLEQHGETLLEEMGSLTSQATTQLARLVELDRILTEAAAAASLLDDADGHLDNIDVRSEVSTLVTDFTRYTKSGASALGSITSNGSTRSGKREERKKQRGKKGTIYEKDYLIDSLRKVPAKAIAQGDEVLIVLAQLISFNMIREAKGIKASWLKLAECVDTIPALTKPYVTEPIVLQDAWTEKYASVRDLDYF